MSDREDLAELLGSLLVSQQQNQDWYVSRSSGGTLCLDGWFDPKVLAGAVLDAGLRPPPRRIETPEELDALPAGSVILAGGQAWQSIHTPVGPLWLLAGGSSDRSSLYVLRVFGPATVLHTPENGDTE